MSNEIEKTELSIVEEISNDLEIRNKDINTVIIPVNEMEQLQILINAKVLPPKINTVEKAYAYAQFGKELGMKPMQAFHQIFDVNGRLALSAKSMMGLLWSKGVTYSTIADYEIQVTGKTKSGEDIKQRVTTIEFYRGNLTERTSFYWNDAVRAGLAERDVWIKWPRNMMWARCASIGANRIAPDIILGMYVVEELMDIKKDKKIEITESGDINLIG